MTCTRARELDLAAVMREPGSEASRSLLEHCERCATCAAELARHARVSSRRSASKLSRGLALGLIAVFAAGLLILLLLSPSEDGPGPQDPADRVNHVATQDSPSAEPPPPATPEGISSALADLTLVSGEAAEISAASLPAGRPLALGLQLAEPSARSEPLSGRVVTEGRAPLEFRAAVRGDDRLTARVEIAAEWLSPGRYVIELHTTEQTHFPLRRYALEVR
jgi:hypothetical protein